MKSVLISIKPKWVAKILNGEKTIEIRKTMPKCDLPIDVYIYCTKDNENNLFCEDMSDERFLDTKPYQLSHVKNRYLEEDDAYLNGKVVAKFTLKEIRLAKYQPYVNEVSKMANKLTCLTDKELDKYLNKKDGYGWVIDDLVIFDKPKELSEFYKIVETTIGYDLTDIKKEKPLKLNGCIPLTKAPQSWQFIETGELL